MSLQGETVINVAEEPSNRKGTAFPVDEEAPAGGLRLQLARIVGRLKGRAQAAIQVIYQLLTGHIPPFTAHLLCWKATSRTVWCSSLVPCVALAAFRRVSATSANVCLCLCLSPFAHVGRAVLPE